MNIPLALLPNNNNNNNNMSAEGKYELGKGNNMGEYIEGEGGNNEWEKLSTGTVGETKTQFSVGFMDILNQSSSNPLSELDFLFE